MLALLGGCMADANPPARADARAIPTRDGVPIDQCDEASADIGRCEVDPTGEECTGVPDETRQFVGLSYGDAVYMVRGPQGAQMFVLALQTTGIVPGDPTNPVDPTNPDVDILLSADGYELARYRGTPGFSPSAGDETVLEAAGLFVILDDQADELIGSEIISTARIVDADGQQRCGQVMFVAKQ
jgi:hypothetical protein